MDHAVRIGCQLLVVRDDHECLVHLVAQVEEELVQFFLVFGIQASRRFVCKDDGRVVDKGAGNGYALFLSPRQFVRFFRRCYSGR